MATEHHIYLVRPRRPDFLGTMTGAEEQLIARHFQYLTDLFHAGKLVMAGPCTDASFGIAILRVADPAEARALMESDPAVREGLFDAELHGFKIAIGAGA